MRAFYQLAKQIYDMKNPREARRAVIFCIRAILHRGQMQKLDAFLKRDALLTELAEIYPFVYEQPTRAFFYSHSTFDTRVALIESHMEFLREHVRDEIVLSLYRKEAFSLWSGIECCGKILSASLFFEPGQRKEGLLSVMLRMDEVSFYQIIFWIAPAHDGSPAMWIGAMQGPNMENARDMVKAATKVCHSYRTKNLILYIAQGVARSLGLRHIYAVTNKGYYANNHIRVDRKLKTDFSEFWRESGGVIMGDTRFMELPLTEIRKTMEEVPTRKRAVYRRRFAFLDALDEEIETSMGRLLKDVGEKT